MHYYNLFEVYEKFLNKLRKDKNGKVIHTCKYYELHFIKICIIIWQIYTIYHFIIMKTTPLIFCYCLVHRNAKSYFLKIVVKNTSMYMNCYNF